MKKLMTVVMFAVLLFCQSRSGFAENQTWVDKSFDFSKINTVYLAEPEYPDNLQEEIAKLQMRDIFYEQAKKVKNVQCLTKQEMEGKLLRYFALDYQVLASQSKEAADKVWSEHLPSLAKVYIKEMVEQYEIGKSWQEPYTYTVTEYEKITVENEGKKTTVTVPKTVEKYVPGEFIYTAYVKVKFNVYTTKENQLIFSYVDYRAAGKSPDGMYKRIVDSFYDKLNKQIN